MRAKPTAPATGSPGAALLPPAARRTAAWCGVALLVAAVGAVAVWLCVELRTAVTPVLLALLATGLLHPVYRRLAGLHLNRSLAAGLTCALLVVVVGGAGYIVGSALADSGAQILTSLRRSIEDVARHLGVANASLDDLAAHARQLLAKFGSTAASGVLTGVSVVAQSVGAAVLALLLTFFFLRDAPRFTAVLHQWAPRNAAPYLERMAHRGFQAIEGFMRGTTLIALIDAVCIAVGLVVLRVPGALGLGALVFVGAYLPYLGAFVSGTLAVLVALADRGFAVALWTLGVVVAVQMLEGHILQPLIQSRTVQMHPAVILLAIAAGASVAGIVGMLLAVPLTAAGTGVLYELRRAAVGPEEPSPSPSEGEGEGEGEGEDGSGSGSGRGHRSEDDGSDGPGGASRSGGSDG